MPAQIWAVFVLTLLHVIEIHLWALAYLVAIPGVQMDTYEKVAYFSFVTFTTLGYGDIVLQGPERLLTGVEALNGMLLIGWSVALLFQVVRRAWKIPNPVP
jgi:voltage-gated potassium channel Kch